MNKVMTKHQLQEVCQGGTPTKAKRRYKMINGSRDMFFY
jgi:hypothetical protein